MTNNPRTSVPQLRECREADFESVDPLLQQLLPQSKLDTNQLRVTYLRGLSSPASRYFCAAIEGIIVGFCSLSVRECLWVQGLLGHVDELVVDAACRGRGIGTQLLEHAERLARSLGCFRLQLDTAFHRTEAHRFYVKLGCEQRALHFSKPLRDGNTVR